MKEQEVVVPAIEKITETKDVVATVIEPSPKSSPINNNNNNNNTNMSKDTEGIILPVKTGKAKEEKQDDVDPAGNAPPAMAAVVEETPSTVTATAAPATDVTTTPTTTTSETKTDIPNGGLSSIPTYEDTERSKAYLLAKSLLASGDLEQALTACEQGFANVKERLALATTTTTTTTTTVDPDLHPALAPLYYLYGTTLLYILEESSDAMAMTSNPSTGVEENASADPNVNANANATSTEDMEIAWENLEAARTIVHGLLQSKDSIHNSSSSLPLPLPQKSKLALDYAQILLRVGDLQRANGRYGEAVLDYEQCLQYRQQYLVPPPLPSTTVEDKGGDVSGGAATATTDPGWDRKIADAQYHLGLCHLSHATELQKIIMTASQQPQEQQQQQQLPPQQEEQNQKNHQLQQEHSRKGIAMYMECAKTLCGQVARLCTNPEENKTAAVSLSSSSSDAYRTIFEAAPVGKTTGLSPEATLAAEHVATLQAWREAAQRLTPFQDPDRYAELMELLQEIQETIQEAEHSQQAMKEAVQLKLNAQKGIQKEDDKDGNAPTTQMGFDAPTLNTTDTVDVSKSGAKAVATAGTTGTQPMMVIKKKKKRPAPNDSTIEDSTTKKPKVVE